MVRSYWVRRVGWTLLGASSFAASAFAKRNTDDGSEGAPPPDLIPEDVTPPPNLFPVNLQTPDGSGLSTPVPNNQPLPVFPGVEQWNHAKWEPNWDKRDPLHLLLTSRQNRVLNRVDYEEEIRRFTPKANRHIILIRHGQYNTAGTTDDERSLTMLGREQAALTGSRLKELGLPFEVILNSTMRRAKETSDVIAGELSAVPRSEDHLLREGAPFPPEPKPKFYAPHEHEFYRDGARIEAAFRKYFHRADVSEERDTYTVLVCHANVIRYFVCRALQFPPESWLRFTLKHASITWLMIRPSGSVILHSFGDTGFMPPDKISVT